jgi:serine/threonine protein kinase
VNEGEVIAGKYRLDEVLGEGAMGVVWLATQLDLERVVAVKVLHANMASRADSRARFVREAKVAAALHHPGAVQVLDFGMHGSAPDRVPSLKKKTPHDAAKEAAPSGELYLVMERLIGGTLRARIEQAPLSMLMALDLARQIANVLEAAHRISLVHRDIKPENVFLEGEADAPRAVVVDCGLAFIADDPGSVGRLTDAGILGGTPAYMSPEQARGKAVGPPSDIYSLGCTLFELIAGRPPFVGAVSEMIARHAFAPPLSLRDVAGAPVPAALDELVASMLGKSPPLRPSASQLVEQLDAIMAELADGDGNRSLRTLDRASRVLPRPDAMAATMPMDADVVLGVEGALDEELRLALATSNIRVTTVDDPAVSAIFAPGATPERLRALAAGKRPVLTDVERADFPAIAACVRAGCHDAVTRPVRPSELARKVRRAWLSQQLP